ncbi:MAG: ETC complex I subunit [Acetobacteraceae bacterium]|nr:ETC complex I subunit [Acetobacteraceae bacterium]MBV8524584.1 ETC complex I subunit [Acetobacteraceae bacterium]
MRARIYQPPKNAMQSGRANTQAWILEYDPAAPRQLDPLMGWVGSGDTQSQVKLHFASEQEAIAYAEKQGLRYDLELPRARQIKPKSYAENFRYGRIENWTH